MSYTVHMDDGAQFGLLRSRLGEMAAPEQISKQTWYHITSVSHGNSLREWSQREKLVYQAVAVSPSRKPPELARLFECSPP